MSRISPGIIRRPFSPRRNQPPTRSTPRSVCTLSPTCTRISVFSSISATAPSRSPPFSFSKKSSIVSTAPMGGVYRRADPWTPPTVTHRRRLAAVRPAPAQRAPRPAPADRRRPDRRLLGCRASRHPPAGRDAVRGRLVDAAEPRLRTRLHAAPLGDARHVDAGELVASTSSSSSTASRSGRRRSKPTGFAVTRTVATPGRGSVARSRAGDSARRCAARSWRSRSTGSVPTVAESSAFLDNAASNGVSRSLGYEENGLGRLAPEGVARETAKFRMTAVVAR